ncbi:MAG: phosphoglycolate phosphatase, partial [Burkholderiales bacterium]
MPRAEMVAGAAANRHADAGRGRTFRARAVIIDLDGTLLDTAGDLAATANAIRAEFGMPPLPVEVIATYVGKGAGMLVHRALTADLAGEVDSETHARGMRAFDRIYAMENGRTARPYPGVLEGLEAMRAKGLRLACVTNKPQAFSDALLRSSGLDGYFELVIGGDALERRKPDPLPMRHVAERFAVPATETVAIGDSVNDVLAAR